MSVRNPNLFSVSILFGCLHGWRCSISFREGFFFFFGLHSLGFVSRALSSPYGRFLFSLSRFIFLFLLYGPQVDPFSYPTLIFFLSACKMVRGYEKVSTSQARHMRGTPRETLTASSFVNAMSAKELGLFSQIPAKINREASSGAATSTFREADNVVYFTQEQYAARLHLFVPPLVKQFLHFTPTPPTLIHPNSIWIFMSCSVLNSLYQLDISLVEICFIYTMKIGIGGRLSMSAHSSRL